MRRDDSVYFLDMLLAAQDISEFLSGLRFEQFKESKLHRNAVLKSIEIIGEAAARITKETRSANPQIPWKEIVGMRNRLVHDYFRVDLLQVWDVAQEDIPPLIDLLRPLVPPENEETV